MASKCFDCARVGKCDKLVPCSKFVLFREYVTIKEVAALCGMHERTLQRKLLSREYETLQLIKKKTGFTFRREEGMNNQGKALVPEPNNCRNSIRLAKALEKLNKN